MRILLVTLMCAVLMLGGCKRRARASDAPKEEAVQLLSAFAVDDPKAAVHLTHGFYALEGNHWRWTAGRFGVVLAPPAGAYRGARLDLKFTIPDVIAKLGAVTLSASVGGTALAPETYPKSGEQTYSRDLPASAFGGGPVAIEFQSDKALAPGTGDARELALIVVSVGLTAK